MAEQPKAVYFLSDAHLGGGPEEDNRRRILLQFLSGLHGSADHLYILGDLFDFWFEYRHAVPKGHFRVLRALADLVEDGTPVTYLGGNHDFWCGSYLSREVGLVVHQRPLSITRQGRRIFLAHGDGLGPGDHGYRLLKAILRSPLAIALYRTIHPDLGIPLAYRVSKASRQHTKALRVILRDLSRHVAGPRFAKGYDAVVTGHIHDPQHLRGPGERDFLIIGDWLVNFTYVRLEGGQFVLERFREAAAPEPIEASPWPSGLTPGEA
jgi:UDP-2,3-diacylglucosamine hydrolase